MEQCIHFGFSEAVIGREVFFEQAVVQTRIKGRQVTAVIGIVDACKYAFDYRQIALEGCIINIIEKPYHFICVIIIKLSCVSIHISIVYRCVIFIDEENNFSTMMLV